MRIVLESYNPQWPAKFQEYRSQILSVLKEEAISIEHIGSTSVPGLSAKSVIDIQVGVLDKNTLDAIIPKMINAGFTYMKVYEHLLPERRYFVKYIHTDGITPPQIFAEGDVSPASLGFINMAHIHCWVYNSADWIRHLAFRDYLKAHEGVRKEYQALKEKLAKRDWESSLAYSEAKNEFIQMAQARAVEWYAANGF